MTDTNVAQDTTREILPSFFAIKMGVDDFERTAAWYGDLFGMTIGPEWDVVKVERALQWPEPGHGPTIIMYNANLLEIQAIPDDMGGDEVNDAIMGGDHAFKAGSSWICVQVEDLDAVSAKLAAMGKPSTIQDVGAVGFEMRIIMTTDPDDNVVEVVQSY